MNTAKLRGTDCSHNLHPAPVYTCTDSVIQFNDHKPFEPWKPTALGKKEGLCDKTNCCFSDPASLCGGQKISECGNAGRKRDNPTTFLRKMACRQEFHRLCKMLSKSLKPVFCQVSPNGAVLDLCKAKTSRANLPEFQDLQPRSVVLLLADERLHRARYSGVS